VVTRIESVISRAQCTPIRRDGISRSNLRYCLGKYDSESQLKMPVNMAMEEPRPGVISLESDSDVVTQTTNVDNVTDDGIVIVVRCTSGAADDMEVVSMQMYGVATTDNASGYTEFDGSVGGKLVDTSGWKKILSILLTTQDLQENWNCGAAVGDAIDMEYAGEVDDEVRGIIYTACLGRSGHTRIIQRAK